MEFCTIEAAGIVFVHKIIVDSLSKGVVQSYLRNTPLLSDPGNAGEENRKRNKGVLVNTRTLFSSDTL
jgi:hypothetical protein